MASRDHFSPTRWTLVLQASGSTPESRGALGELCEIYYAPVVTFIRHWWVDANEDIARDLAHSFFESVLEIGELGKADPARGSFRSYLLGAVKHFLMEQRRLASTQKRGGDVVHEPFRDDAETGVAGEADFDREWALALIGRALGELEAEMESAGKMDQFEGLKPWLDGNARTSQAEAAEALGLSGTAVKVAIHRLRERFRRKVRAEVAATLHDPEELDAELRHLIAALGASPQR